MQSHNKFNDSKISIRQMQAIIILWIFSMSIVCVPYVLTDIFSLLSGAVLLVIQCMFVCWTSKKIAYNKVIEKLAVILAGISIIAFGGVLIRIMASAVNSFILPRTPVYALAITIILAAFYCSILGMQTVGRVSEIIFAIVAVTAVLAIIFSFAGFEVSGFNNTYFINKGIMKNSLMVMFMMGTPSLLLVILPYTNGQNREVSAVKASIIAVLISAIFILIALFKFGQIDLSKRVFPVLNVLDTVRLPFIFGDKKDVFMIRLWLFAVFSAIATAVYVGGSAFSGNSSTSKIITLICAVGMLAISLILLNAVYAFGIMLEVGKISAVVFGVILPLICLFIKKKGSADSGK